MQINKDVDKLRKFISDNHYTILNEVVLKDDKYYQIVVFNTKYHDCYSQLEIDYGPILLKNRETIFIDYLKDLKERYRYFNADGDVLRLNKKINEIDYVLGIIEHR